MKDKREFSSEEKELLDEHFKQYQRWVGELYRMEWKESRQPDSN
jgi:hypothetical protein